MIGFRRKNREVLLPSDFSIKFEMEFDVLDFDSLGQQYSWPLRIPIEGNETLFSFAEDHANPKNGFKTYDGFFLTFNGNVWLEMSFELHEAKNGYYSGSLTSISDDLMVSQAVGLSEITQTKVAISNSSFSDINDQFNDTSYPTVCFPQIQVRKNISGYYNEPGSLLNPCFGIHYLIKNICSEFGYQFIDNYSSNNNKFKKLIIIPDKQIDFDPPGLVRRGTRPDSYNFDHLGNTIELSKYLPEDYTFFDLLTDLAKWTCSEIVINSFNKTLEINSISRLIKKTPTDLREALIHNYQPGSEATTAPKIVLHISYEDELLEADVTENLEGNYRGEYTNTNDMIANLTDPEVGDYAFSLRDNSYWQVKGYTGSLLEAINQTGDLLPHIIISNLTGTLSGAGSLIVGSDSGAAAYITSIDGNKLYLSRFLDNHWDFLIGEQCSPAGATFTVDQVATVINGANSGAYADVVSIDGSDITIQNGFGLFEPGETVTNGTGASAEVVGDNSQKYIDYYSDPYQKLPDQGDIELLKLSPILEPLKFDRYMLRTLSTGITIEESGVSDPYGFGKLKLILDGRRPLGDLTGFSLEQLDIRLTTRSATDDNESPEYTFQWFNFDLVSNNEIHIDETFIDEADIEKIEIRILTLRYTPIVLPEHNPKIAYFHGMQPDTSVNQTLYPYAAPHNYNSQSQDLGGLALRIFQSNNIYDDQHNSVNSKLSGTRILQYLGNLSQLHITKSISTFRTILSKKAKILVRSISTNLTSNGIQNQEIEGYKI